MPSSSVGLLALRQFQSVAANAAGRGVENSYQYAFFMNMLLINVMKYNEGMKCIFLC